MWFRTWHEGWYWGIPPLFDFEFFPRHTYYYVWWSNSGVGVAAPIGHGMWGIRWWLAVTLTAILPAGRIAARGYHALLRLQH